VKITLDDIESPRGELALERFASGGWIYVADLRLSVSLERSGEVEVIVWSEWDMDNAPEGADEEAASRVARNFGTLCQTWARLGALVAGCKRTVELRWDYGGGAIVLGRLSDDGEYTPAR
jgi:hypothetical protein